VKGPAAQRVDGTTTLDVTLTNTGTAATTDSSLHPRDAAPYLNSDVYRVSLSVDGQGWSAALQTALVALKFGESKAVPVQVTRAAGSVREARVTFTAVSESDPSKTATVTCAVSAGVM
jgi:hypothetical protein